MQALTLIYGGRDPRIRIEQTIEALGRLADFGYLPPTRARNLAGGLAAWKREIG